MTVLLPIWHDKRETARRVRQRIGAIMKWAIAHGHRQDNPAGEASAAALPRNGAVRKHMAALPHGEVAGALAKVRASAAGTSTNGAAHPPAAADRPAAGVPASHRGASGVDAHCGARPDAGGL